MKIQLYHENEYQENVVLDFFYDSIGELDYGLVSNTFRGKL